MLLFRNAFNVAKILVNDPKSRGLTGRGVLLKVKTDIFRKKCFKQRYFLAMLYIFLL